MVTDGPEQRAGTARTRAAPGLTFSVRLQQTKQRVTALAKSGQGLSEGMEMASQKPRDLAQREQKSS